MAKQKVLSSSRGVSTQGGGVTVVIRNGRKSKGGTFWFAFGIIVTLVLLILSPSIVPYVQQLLGKTAIAGAIPCVATSGQSSADSDKPVGSPLWDGKLKVVMTQGYDVGSHAPAAVWGGVDLGIDSDGDGFGNPEASNGSKIYATMDGVVHIDPNSWPAGNFVTVKGVQYTTRYAHLSKFAVEEGQTVTRGSVIGYVGMTGQANGPHLHYEVWKQGANVNPLEFGALDERPAGGSAPCPAPVPLSGSGVNMSIVGKSTISATRYDEILRVVGSPMQNVGAFAVSKGNEVGINAAVTLAFFSHESSYGVNPNWAGHKPGGATTHNIGNIICAGYASCYGRFRNYVSWDEGIEDWYKLLKKEYVEGRGLTTLLPIIEVYAPAGPPDYNDPNGYATHVASLVACYADESIPADQCK
jgi:hypothetical protein